MNEPSSSLPVPQACSVAQLCPPGVDLGGEYLLWLDEACPVHSLVVAGVDIPKFVYLVPQVCPSCGHRETPEANVATGALEHATCPVCAAAGKQVRMRPERQAAPMRTHKRMRLSDAQVRAIWAKLDPQRELRYDEARGRRLDGPRMIPAKGGRGEVPAFPFVRLKRVEQAGEARLQAESPAEAAERAAALRKFASMANELARPGLHTATRAKRVEQLKQLSKQLGIPVDEYADNDVEVEDAADGEDACEQSGEASASGSSDALAHHDDSNGEDDHEEPEA